MGKALKQAKKRADKLAALNRDIAEGGDVAASARKAKRVMADTWVRRDMNPGDFHKPKKQGGKALSLNACRSHIVASL